MKIIRLLTTLAGIVRCLLYILFIVNIFIAMFNSDWTRGIFFLLAFNFVQGTDEDSQY